jgi:hypothetical protein
VIKDHRGDTDDQSDVVIRLTLDQVRLLILSSIPVDIAALPRGARAVEMMSALKRVLRETLKYRAAAA